MPHVTNPAFQLFKHMVEMLRFVIKVYLQAEEMGNLNYIEICI